ncbi:hypothetical protein [Mycolicibacterium mengxianglii]|uniref:hypothetical protein n=1 Tax=Mycolicibacterium mengxianglii TaxID=2736649 RepID=UPI003556FAC9
MTPDDKTPGTDGEDVVDDAAENSVTDDTNPKAAEADTTADVTTSSVSEDSTSVPEDSEVTDSEVAESDSAAESDDAVPEPSATKAGVNWSRVLAFGLLPALALLLGAGAGYLKWQDSSVRDTDFVRIQSLQIAKDATVKLLSYKPDTVEQDLGSARDLLTGEFRDSYTQLIDDVVIPGAKEKQISAVATVPAAASVSAELNKAVVLVFVNQTVMVGTGAPTATTSSVQMTLDRVGDRWLISAFDPV